jgi:hypothetical protein
MEVRLRNTNRQVESDRNEWTCCEYIATSDYPRAKCDERVESRVGF